MGREWLLNNIGYQPAMAVKIGISDWSGWTTAPPAPLAADSPLRVSDAPDASAIPALLRRRLNTLGRAAAAELLRLPAGEHHAPVVYSSRHGDIARTLSVLLELARDESVSPMNFSLAVHNAIPGILSIHSGNTANITSLAALEESLVPALLEAAGMLQEGHRRVLCLFADVPVPDIYRPCCPEPAAPYAASFIVSAAADDRFSLEFVAAEEGARDADVHKASVAPDSPGRPEALRFVEYLSSGAHRFDTRHNGGFWALTRS